MFTWHAHEEAVTALAFGPNGRFLVSAGADECVTVWDPLTGTEQARIPLRVDDMLRMPGDATGPLRHLVVSGDGARVVVSQPAIGLVFVDLEREEVAFTHTFDEVLAVKSAPDGESVFVCPMNPVAVYQSRFADGEQLHSLPGPTWPARAQAIGVSPSGSHLAVGHLIYQWPPIASPPRSTRVQVKNYTPEDLAFSADNSHLFALVGGKIVVYSLPGGLFKTKLKGHDGRITAMALAPDGRRLWTASRDATVKCWDTFSLTLDRTYTFQTGGLDCLAVSPDGNVAAVGSGQKGTITLWDLD